MIQNLEVEVDIDIMTELFELKISIRSKVFNLLLMEWSERRDFCCLHPKTAGESMGELLNKSSYLGPGHPVDFIP